MKKEGKTRIQPPKDDKAKSKEVQSSRVPNLDFPACWTRAGEGGLGAPAESAHWLGESSAQEKKFP